ncbi:uncharacterized protein N7446_009420 [Penicillium canescens]|uniref:uncharacterized protein n=1 Tax=Penicillium canescens TaxID=5083 RepID=UPI0026DFE368|nr:uncharacterized protein N7446_009420 [Penicillium canescens]KAJ6053408.1 hypothetical protein N7446_009420 [Penicillium canescens]
MIQKGTLNIHTPDPFFFEFPRQMGKYSEGTLLLVGNLLPSNGSTTNFFAWRSEDHGETWDAAGEWQHGGPSRSGIWEPFLYMDKKGRLVAAFSDERQNRMHSQMLANVVSEDGGDTWGDIVKAVASSRVRDRQGMATVAKMGNGEYIMSYEFCEHPDCPVHTKTSKDGVSWNANDTGIRIDTADASDPFQPYTLLNPKNQPSPENSRSVFINKSYGKGEWVWAPAPWTVPNGTRYCKANYSPDLLPLSNGVVRYTAPAGQGNGSFCWERTGKAPIGALPYTANFTAYGQAGWIDFGGSGTCRVMNYKIIGDIIITGSSGSVGLNVRMSASGTGLNKLKGYAVAVDSATGKLTTYRHANNKTVMHSGAHPEGI